MDNTELALRLQETTDRSVRNEGRIKKLEGEHEALHQLATSVAVMAQKMETMTTSVNTLTGKVEELEGKPGKRWEAIVDKALWAVVGGVIAFLLAQVGIA